MRTGENSAKFKKLLTKDQTKCFQPSHFLKTAKFSQFDRSVAAFPVVLR